MTDDEARAALAALTKHFGEPVQPLSKFCDAISAWFRAIERNNEDPELRRDIDPRLWTPEHQHGHSYYKHLRRIETDIRKSYLLARLLYGGEKLRMKMCPEHKGHWDGPAQLGFPGQECPHGCQGAGWLPEPEDEAKYNQAPGSPAYNIVAVKKPVPLWKDMKPGLRRQFMRLRTEVSWALTRLDSGERPFRGLEEQVASALESLEDFELKNSPVYAETAKAVRKQPSYDWTPDDVNKLLGFINMALEEFQDP